MRSQHAFRCGLVLAICLLVTAGQAFAQGTTLGTIRGTVMDTQGGAVAGAKVRVIDLETNLDRELTTDQAGNYEAPNLRPGSYKVNVSFRGFKTVEVINVAVRGAEIMRADARLEPSPLAEAITVTTEAPVIQTETPTLGATLTTQEIIDLPRDSRDILDFLYLNPNITQSADGGGFKFIGAQSYGASFSLDGQRSNGGVFGEPTGSQPSLETIGELTVLSNNFTAEYAGIANIRISTKRGGANYHGSAFYNNKNSALAAWKIDDKIGQASFNPTPAISTFPKPYFNLNEIGGSIHGPVPVSKHRTFFLMSFEHRWSASPLTFRSTRAVAPSLLAGDFSGIQDSRKPVIPPGVTLTPAELAANTITAGGTPRLVTIPQRLLNPSVRSLIKNYFPQVSPAAPFNATNGRLIDYYENRPNLTERDLATLRFDHDITAKDKIYVVYNVSREDGGSSLGSSNPYPAIAILQRNRHNHTLSASYSRFFSNNFINEVRGGFNTQATYRRAKQTLGQFLTSLGFDKSDSDAYAAVVGKKPLDIYGQMAVNFGSLWAAFPSGSRNADRQLDQGLMTFGDTVTWIKGRHSIRAGADLVRNHAIDGFANGRGQVRGSVTYTGSNLDPLARFLTGQPPNSAAYVVALRGPMDVANWEHGYFIQEDFKIHPRLTLNLGLRYELITPFIDANNYMVNFDPTYASPAGRKGRFVVPAESMFANIDPRMVAYGVTTADKAGVSRGLVNADKNNLAPRSGLAFRLTDKTVIRGGYGLFYPTAAAQGIRDAMESSPFNQGRTKTNTADAPLSGWPGAGHGFSPLTGGYLRVAGGQPNANSIPFNLQSPRIDQYNITLEREIVRNIGFRVSYMGTRMSGLIAGIDLNMIPPNDKPYGTTTGDGVTPCSPADGDCDLSPADIARKPFPELGSYMARYGNMGNGRSHALQTEVKRGYVKGLMFNVTYTLLKQDSDGLDTGNSSLGGTLFNQFKPNSDYARDAFISRHRLVAYGSYRLPFGRGRQFGSAMPKFLDSIIGGWDISSHMFAKSGTGFTPYWECENCDPLAPGNTASEFTDAVGGFGGTSYRPLLLADPVGGVSGDKIWNVKVFGQPLVGSDVFDNPKLAKRNFLTGPGTWGLNLSIRKNFRIRERLTANLGAMFDNLFNHPLLSPTDNEIARLGSFALDVDPKTTKLVMLAPTVNPDFGRLRSSFNQESIDNRRSVRLMLRFTF